MIYDTTKIQKLLDIPYTFLWFLRGCYKFTLKWETLVTDTSHVQNTILSKLQSIEKRVQDLTEENSRRKRNEERQAKDIHDLRIENKRLKNENDKLHKLLDSRDNPPKDSMNSSVPHPRIALELHVSVSRWHNPCVRSLIRKLAVSRDIRDPHCTRARKWTERSRPWLAHVPTAVRIQKIWIGVSLKGVKS